LLRDLAARSPDKAFAAQLNQHANILSDRALQVKMITAVKAASGDTSTDQVRSASNGLKNSITETMEALITAALKKRLAATIDQVHAIDRITEAWKQTL